MKTKQLIPILLTLGFLSYANAGFYLEPNISYVKTDYSLTDIADNSGTGSTTGTQLGLRVGYQLPVLVYFGIDADMATGKYKAGSDAMTTDADVTRTSLYGIVGVQLPVLLRVYAGVSLMDNETDKDVDSTNYFKATGMKVGLGYNLLPMVTLNVDYTIRDLKKIKIDDGEEFDVSSFYSKAKANILAIGIGVRF